jgi:hypothetical protein
MRSAGNALSKKSNMANSYTHARGHTYIYMREAYTQQEFSREDKFFREKEFLKGEEFLKEEDSLNSHACARHVCMHILEAYAHSYACIACEGRR